MLYEKELVKQNADDKQVSALTNRQYWNRNYQQEHAYYELLLEGFRNHASRRIFEKLAPLIKPGHKVLEIGAGDSAWLQFLARRFPSTHFAGLDYSDTGIQKLADRAHRYNLNIKLIMADVFDIPEFMVQQYDLLISFGVVEHFDNLENVLRTFAIYLKPGGHVFTLIPNMNGTVALLSKLLDRSVYDIHNPHDLDGFIRGHENAGFTTEAASYFLSTDYSVLSATTKLEHKYKHQLYLSLSRLSKLVWIFEDNLFPLPNSRWFSPFIYYTGVKPDA